MSGHFEKGRWIDGMTVENPNFIPLCIDLEKEIPSAVQVERVAKLLNLKDLSPDELNGEMIIKGASGKWYRILDFFEYLLKRMK